MNGTARPCDYTYISLCIWTKKFNNTAWDILPLGARYTYPIVLIEKADSSRKENTRNKLNIREPPGGGMERNA